MKNYQASKTIVFPYYWFCFLGQTKNKTGNKERQMFWMLHNFVQFFPYFSGCSNTHKCNVRFAWITTLLSSFILRIEVHGNLFVFSLMSHQFEKKKINNINFYTTFVQGSLSVSKKWPPISITSSQLVPVWIWSPHEFGAQIK